MWAQVRVSILLIGFMTLVTGIIYPLTVTVLARVVFPKQATGSLIAGPGGVMGSELIGQNFTRPEYFWGRLSATSPVPYNPSSSGGSNFGPSHPDLKKAALDRVEALVAAGSPGENIPVELVTASGSGLDPHISPAAADFQVARVAKRRGLAEDRVRALVSDRTETRQLGVLGEARVNVLLLNLDLDRATGR